MRMCARVLVTTIVATVFWLIPWGAGAKDVPASGIQVRTDLRYGDRRFGESHTLDLYLPAEAGQPRPVVVFIHGGGWERGNGAKDYPPVLFLVGRGYAVASINYRLSDDAPFPAQLRDCKAAVRWLRGKAASYNLDPDRIGAWGVSAGGHLAALLGATGHVKESRLGDPRYFNKSSAVQAVCDWCGPTDLERCALVGGYTERVVRKLLDNPRVNRRELADEANPNIQVKRTQLPPGASFPPFLIVHGDRDDVVPLEQSELLRDALAARGAQVELRTVPSADHKIGLRDQIELVTAFFDRHLGVKDPHGKGRGGGLKKAGIVATYNHQAGNLPPRDIHFYSNGYIELPNGPDTWVIQGNRLVMYWYSNNKGPLLGVWVDTCDLSPDGKTYHGRNQDGAPIVGRKVANPR